MEIIAGLRVFTNDCVWGTVESTQFESDSIIAPGGKYFDGFFRVAVDIDGQPSSDIRLYDGERMSTVKPPGLR
ncbi:hypothetical protein BGM09_00860 [Streptomyces sp. CBMA29]|nr:hypothetical protein [Streptomyces sp. CBMA29]